MLNYYYHYKNVGRFILFLKYSYKRFDSVNIPQFDKLSLFFDIQNINDLNNLNILSNIFFFKYYFGVLPFFSNYSYKFKLNFNYYSFFVQYNFFQKYLYYPLYFFFNDIYFMINKVNLSLSSGASYKQFCISDMNFFIEKKNTLGFFNLNYKLYFKFFIANLTGN